MQTSLDVRHAAEPPREWRRLTDRHGTFYHDPRWVVAVARHFRYSAHCLTAWRGNEPVGLLALAEVPGLFARRRLVSYPFSHAAGPLALDYDADRALCRAAVELARDHGIARVEIKRAGTEAPMPDGFVRMTRYATYRITVDPARDLLEQIPSESTRRSVRKALRGDIVVDRGTTAEAWLTMARLNERTATRHGVPAPPRSFFAEACLELQRNGLADLYVARIADRAAAGLVVWKGTRQWIYAFGASHPRYLSIRPNHALLWRALEDAAERGVELDLGRAAPEQRGLVRFKLHWGGQPRDLAYDYWPDAAGLNVAPRDRGPLALAARFWSLLPIPIARFGGALYRYLG